MRRSINSPIIFKTNEIVIDLLVIFALLGNYVLGLSLIFRECFCNFCVFLVLIIAAFVIFSIFSQNV